MSARKEVIMERLNELLRLAHEAELKGEKIESIDVEIKQLREEFGKLNDNRQILNG